MKCGTAIAVIVNRVSPQIWVLALATFAASTEAFVYIVCGLVAALIGPSAITAPSVLAPDRLRGQALGSAIEPVPDTDRWMTAECLLVLEAPHQVA